MTGQQIGGAAGVILCVIVVVILAAWLKAVVNYDPDDPNSGCAPGTDCEYCPFPCDRSNHKEE